MKGKKNKGEESFSIGLWGTILFTAMMVIYFIIANDVLFDRHQGFYEKESEVGIKKDDYLSLRVKRVLGNYAETRHYSSFIPTGTDRFYIVLLDNDEIISLTVKETRDIIKLDNLSKQTWANNQNGEVGLDVAGITFKGTIKTIDPKILDYYEDALNRIGISESNMRKIYWVTLDATDTPKAAWGMMLLVCALDALCIFFLVTSIMKKRREKMQTQFVSKIVVLEDDDLFADVNGDGRVNAKADTISNVGPFVIKPGKHSMIFIVVVALIAVGAFIGCYWNDIELYFVSDGRYNMKNWGFLPIFCLCSFGMIVLMLLGSVVYSIFRSRPVVEGDYVTYKGTRHIYSEISMVNIDKYKRVNVYVNKRLWFSIERICDNRERFIEWAMARNINVQS